MTDMTLTEGAIGQTGVLKAVGDCDVYAAPKLRESLLRLDASGHARILLDLTGCTFLDATGLAVIVGGLKRAREQGGDLRIACDEEPILRVFRTTGLTRVFVIYPSRDAAVKAIEGGAW